MSYAYVRTERSGNVGLIVLSDVSGKNALRPQTMQELCQATDELIAAPDVHAIVLAADGRHFCAGADYGFLKQLATAPTADAVDQIYRHFQGAVRRIYHSGKPTVAAIDGAAITVGCELALACDFRIVTERAFFQESWIRVGLLPALGGMYLLPKLVGLSRAKDMVLRAQAISGREALQIGLATELVDAEQLRGRAIELAAELAALPHRAYALAKEGLHQGLGSTLEREWPAAIAAQATLLASPDFQAATQRIPDKTSDSAASRG